MDDKNKALEQKVSRIFLIIFLALLSWFAYERLTVITNSDMQSATVLDCKDEWTTYRPSTGSSTSTTTRTTVISAPLAITEDGQMAYGNVKVPEKTCQRMIGTTLSVFVHKDDASKNRINSFLQFWLFPSFILYCLFGMMFNTRKPLIGGILSVMIFCLFGYFIAAELNYANFGKKPVPIKANI